MVARRVSKAALYALANAAGFQNKFSHIVNGHKMEFTNRFRYREVYPR